MFETTKLIQKYMLKENLIIAKGLNQIFCFPSLLKNLYQLVSLDLIYIIDEVLAFVSHPAWMQQNGCAEVPITAILSVNF